MRPTILIPVNRLARAKGRLDGVLSPRERRDLAVATLLTVHAAAVATGHEVVVLTADPEVRSVLPAAQVMDEDPGASGLNEQLEAAVRRLSRGVVLSLHADLPFAREDALLRVMEAGADGDVVIVESSDGGTNAMLAPLPLPFALAYGRESAALHRQAAREAGLTVVDVVEPLLALDLDTLTDLRAFFATDGWEATAAAAVLGPLRKRLLEGTVVADEGQGQARR